MHLAFLLYIKETWNVSAWENQYQRDYIYNGALLSQHLTKWWNGTLWIITSKTDYTYPNINTTEETYLEWSGVTASWENDYKLIKTYSSFNKIFSLIGQYSDSSGWTNNYKYIYNYNLAFKLTNEVFQVWDTTVWRNNNQSVITYSGNTVSTIIDQNWNANNWDNASRRIFTFNINEYPINEIRESWNGTNYIFDINNGDYKNRFYYETYNNSIAVTDLIILFGYISIYPNPTQSTLAISFDKKSNTTKQVVLTDILGKILSSSKIEKNNQENTMDLSSFTVGNYFIKVTDENGATYSAKITKY